ncbi:hypothetical protein QUF56_06635 [Ureibacillus composti]|nr:hypothetical protein [Ureibacillus composti]
MKIGNINFSIFKQIYTNKQANSVPEKLQINEKKLIDSNDGGLVYSYSLTQKNRIFSLTPIQQKNFNNLILEGLTGNQQEEFNNILQIIYSPEFMKRQSEAGGLAKAEEDAWAKYIEFIDKVYGEKLEELNEILNKVVL